MLGIALPVGDAGGLLGGVGEQVLALPRIESGQRAGGCRGAEIGAQAVGAVGAAARPREAERQGGAGADVVRSEEHTSELQSLMRISSAVFCLKKKNKHH